MLPKNRRLNLRYNFQLFRETAKRFNKPGITFYYLPKKDELSRISVAISKKATHHTPAKNKLKRQILAQVKDNNIDSYSFDILIMAHQDLSIEQLRDVFSEFQKYVSHKNNHKID